MNQSPLILIFHPDYEKNSQSVKDQRIFKIVQRKFEFLKTVGLNYPSLNAKKLQNMQKDGEDMWEFYITKKWRCFFLYNNNKKTITVLYISNHL